jgi:uncharacterized cupredoxin-like copper-binding protein
MARARNTRTTSRRQKKGALAAALDRAGLLPGRGAAITLIALAAIGIGAIIRATTPWDGDIVAKESEWKIVVSADRHVAGEISFDLSNKGTIPHEFLVAKSNKTAAELLEMVDPTTNRIDEELLDVVDEQPEYAAGTTAVLTLDLAPGHYVVLCNIEGHYKNGMYADLDVVAIDGSVPLHAAKTPAPPATGAIDGAEKEWAVEISSDLHVAGDVTFNLKNEGSIPHEFIVARSDKSADELLALVDPSTHRIDEEVLDAIGEQPEYAPGESKTLTLNLTPGHYVVFCNIEGHYANGMRADLDIADSSGAVPANPPSTTTIGGMQSEWLVATTVNSHVPGDVTFNLKNLGTIPHEFIVIKSDLSAKELLAKVDPATHRLDEDLLDAIGEQPEYLPGESKVLVLKLAPGHYVLMCNIEGHYANGMYTDLVIAEPL